jgi:hypothetical protein
MIGRFDFLLMELGAGRRIEPALMEVEFDFDVPEVDSLFVVCFRGLGTP